MKLANCAHRGALAAEQIARGIQAAAGPGAALDSHGTSMLRAARTARQHGQRKETPTRPT